ncbi:hypothetical protein G8764_05345 [Pseudomaricurvus alcaniphilus]|uniref:hypothetical protein n=1 Tax=Pseudomaricurvus alcaniphilus TaxID=1166482 RepID=UPI001407241C|nr:hypothetical protein [Pseudomaricurvus alcaniphilus]NHN36714.1 hypothetical protein [Pseudomaricurvus alcaniphilus]
MNRILKQNAYKCVKLQTDEEGQRYVSKAYSNQGAEQDRKNTQYIDQALTFFYRNFSTYVRVPEPLAVDLAGCEIRMEYLPNLPLARLLRLSDLSLAKKFFEACYQHNTDADFLRGIEGSVIMTPGLQQLLDSNFPLALGFKGDLSENLVLGGDELILADIDSICLEPLGLSELILYAERFASIWLYPTLRSLLVAPPTPVAFQFLNKSQAQALIEATLEVLNDRMSHVRGPLKSIKRSLAGLMLNRTLARATR